MNRLFAAMVLSGCVVLGTASSAFSWEESRFLGIDRDADGVLSASEADAYYLRLFKEYDLNSDGQIAFEEYVKAENLRPVTAPAHSDVTVPDVYRDMDSNGDTIVTTDEIKAFGVKRFNALDTNGDSKISKDEFVSPGL